VDRLPVVARRPEDQVGIAVSLGRLQQLPQQGRDRLAPAGADGGLDLDGRAGEAEEAAVPVETLQPGAAERGLIDPDFSVDGRFQQGASPNP